MKPLPKRILVVAHDAMVRTTRVYLLKRAGYTVESVSTDDDAMRLLETELFDLILIGRKSQIPEAGLDQRLRKRHPNLLILKIEPEGDIVSPYPSRTTDPLPQRVIQALKDMLS
jgi:DNA-binding response OmpR family regulator